MHQFVKDIASLLTDTILPSRCVVCRQEHPSALCPECISLLTPAELSCAVCGKPSLGGMAHSICATRTTPLQVFALYDYRDRRVAKSIIAGKYSLVQDVFRAYAALLGPACVQQLQRTPKSIISPIPLHSRRLAWRGFNQAALLAQGIAHATTLPYVDALIRVRYTKQQKDLHAAERTENVHNCFTVHPDVVSAVAGMHVILTDDVYTTGNTMAVAAQTLRDAGAAQVSFVTVAKE
ncbi:MAG: ComF family protein [Candidatus Doudnabacteria bacterium]|nr:ComF family protein [Candidatus Doudnabacteria bacterium]